jgi:hypothetical protein
MIETNTIAEIGATSLAGTSVEMSTTTAPTVRSLAVPHHGMRGGILLLTATLLSAPSIKSDVGELTRSRLLSSQVTESRVLADEGGPDARQLRRAALYRMKATQLPPEQRERRIAKALAILNTPNPISGLDRETWKWVAEEASLEDI